VCDIEEKLFTNYIRFVVTVGMCVECLDARLNAR